MTPDEAQAEALRRVLITILGATGTGLAARAALAAVSPSTYVSAEVPKPKKVVIPLLGPEAPPAPPALGPPAAPEKFADVKEWLTGKLDLSNLPLPTTQKPMSGVTETDPAAMPWLPVLAFGGALGGLGGGWYLGDQAVKAYQRRRAQKELEAARKAYQDEILAAYGGAKEAADADYDALAAGDEPTHADMKEAKAALETAFKAAAFGWPDFERSLLYRTLFPATNVDEYGSAVNLLTLLGSAGLAGYGGYRYARDTDIERLRREAAEAAGKEDLEERPPVLVGEIRPRPALKPSGAVSMRRRLASLGA